MSHYNSASTRSNRTLNLAGGVAYVSSPKLALASLLLTSFVQDQFYRSETDTEKQLVTLMGKVDPLFSAKAAVYARTKFGMRTISHLAARELAHTVKGQEWSKNFYDKVVYRPDDMTEILAAYISKYGKPVPNSLKKGFARAFDKFDPYQLAKYRGEDKNVSLVDVVNLVRPVPTEDNAEALAALIAGTLRNTNTFESKLSAAGQEGGDKAEAWTELVKTRKIGYFALLKNLRNIVQTAPELVPDAVEMLTNEKLIKKSLVLPFRFITAYDEIEKISGKESREVLMGLNKALDISVSNVPKLNGDTLVALDISGSMGGRTQEIAGLFAAILVKSQNADLIRYDSTAEYKSVNPLDSTLTIANQISDSRGGTSLNSVFEVANRKYDRVVIISDMQSWLTLNQDYYRQTGGWNAYKTKYGTPKVFSFDIAGYGTLEFPEHNVYTMAGFSDKVFDIMKLLEEDRDAMVNEIEKIQL